MVRLTPGQLATKLAELEVQVTDLHVERRDISLPDYPGGPRPSSVVHVSGQGATGRGECVAFSDEEQRAFGPSMAAWFAATRKRASLHVGGAVSRDLGPYASAALEAALIDLGLRQAGLSLFDLCGLREASMRFVVSLAASPTPLAAIAQVRDAGFTGQLKIDVEPTWNDATLSALAGDPSIAIFDFKAKGELALANRLAALCGQVLFEDPPAGFNQVGHISRDASVPDARAVNLARARGEAVNLKAPRMGGPLEVLRGLEAALALGANAPVLAYLGGMFEVSVGRSQARQMAALYCANGPNDLAPNISQAASTARESSPALVRFDQPGFGIG